MTALHFAAMTGHNQSIKVLLQKGVNINAQDNVCVIRVITM
jgi:ankyrin repeat protein